MKESGLGTRTEKSLVSMFFLVHISIHMLVRESLPQEIAD